MADQNSFDVVSKVDMQEIKNAIDQALKEIHQRFDFKGTKTELTLKEKENELVIVSDDDYKLKSVVDILEAKLIKRNVSVEKAKEIVKEIKEGKFKAQAQIQGDQLRVQSKSRDELQVVITFLKGKDFGVDLQYINYR